jgi:hypothetical protein
MKKRIYSTFSSCLICLFIVPGFIFSGTIHQSDHTSDYSSITQWEFASKSSSEPDVSIDLVVKGCPAWGYCDETPQLNFMLSGSKDGETKYTIYVLINDKLYEFPGNYAQLSVDETPEEGSKVTYWAESTTTAFALADQSFRMRYIKSGSQHLFELLGDQWVDDIPGGALIWDLFPPMDLFESGWAQRITNPDDLNTSVDYTLLAGRLIWEGIVVPEDCPDRGLLANGATDTCGTEAAREKVIDWQNKHNQDIMEAALNARVPARLLKGVIAQESQFYAKWDLPEEYGLGMLTEHGVDMLLQWNEAYYMKKCGQVYGADYCSNGYLNITNARKAVLIGYVMQNIGTDNEYQVLAEALTASCYQAYYIVSYYTDLKPNQVADYETMWRIALGIYHAGFGCMSDGVSAGWGAGGGSLTWDAIAPYLAGDCSSAADYFDMVTNYTEQ